MEDSFRLSVAERKVLMQSYRSGASIHLKRVILLLCSSRNFGCIFYSKGFEAASSSVVSFRTGNSPCTAH